MQQVMREIESKLRMLSQQAREIREMQPEELEGEVVPKIRRQSNEIVSGLDGVAKQLHELEQMVGHPGSASRLVDQYNGDNR